MKITRRLLGVAAAVATLFIYGCSCSSSKSRVTPQPPSEFAVSGVASKGILRGFVVSAHRFNNGALDTTPIATAVTNSGGGYLLAVPQVYSGQPLLFRVTPAASGSRMVCDLAENCGEILFGQEVPIAQGDDFVLDSVIPSAGQGSVANITALTDIAAKLAVAQLTSGATQDSIRALIAQSNMRVANRFNIIGDITRLAVIDLTSSAAVAAALNAGNFMAIKAASYGPAIIMAMRDIAPNLSIGQAMLDFSNYYAGGGIAGNVSNPSVISLDAILGRCLSVLNRVASHTNQNLGAIVNEVTNDREMARDELVDERDAGSAPDYIPNELDRVKAMVQDIRDITTAFGEIELTGGVTIDSVLDQFGTQVEAAELVSRGEINLHVEALARVASAIEAADRAYNANNSLTSHTHDGITVAIASGASGPIFSIEQAVSVEGGSIDVDLSATYAYTVEDSEAGEDRASGSFALMGTLTGDELQLTIEEGSSGSVEEVVLITADDEEDLTLQAFQLQLSLGLTQLDVTDPLTIKGSLSAHIMNGMVSTADEDGVLTFDPLSLSFSGDVSNTSGERFVFAVTLSGSVHDARFSDLEEGDVLDNLSNAQLNLTFTARLAGIPNAVRISLAAAGDADNNGSLALKLQYYPGKTLHIRANITDGEFDNQLVITDHNSVIMTLNEVEVPNNTVLEGNITLNGVQYATISEETIGTVLITFSDGTFESF